MPKVSVYLPDELYREAKEHGLPISALAQQAVEAALRRASTDEWVARMRARPAPETPRPPFDISELMDEVRDEFGR
jgi:hypothetical protein